jgi:hypothetical protein
MNINKWGALQIEKGACCQTNSQCQNFPKSFSTKQKNKLQFQRKGNCPIASFLAC